MPESFGQYGHYRGKALAEIAAREPFWARRGACDKCHDKIVQKLAQAEHQGLSCETCHGPSKAHVESPEVKLPKMSYDKCVRCHAASPSRPNGSIKSIWTPITREMFAPSAMIPTNPSHEQ